MADYKYKEYQESDAVRQAKAALDAQAAQKPGAYQSQWQQSLNDTINKIQNREKFSYDLNGDALYQQYKDRYVQQGQMAMMDTMGQAAALTGGYGSSYGQSVGQQAYQGYLQQLNDKAPELYQLALNQYNQEGQDLYNQYAMLGERESADYGRYRDSVGDWQSERDYLSGQYNTERDYDYSKYSDERNFDYGKYTDDRNYQYQVGRDQVADSQWQKEYDEAMRQYNESMQYQKDRDTVADSQWNQSFQYQQDRDKVSDSQWDQSFQYQQNRDQVSDSQWQTEFDEALRQYNESLQYQKDRDTTSNSQWQAEFDEAKRQYDQNYAFNQQQYNDSKTTSKVTTTTGGVSVDNTVTPETEPEGTGVSDTIKNKAAGFTNNTDLANYLDGLTANGIITEDQSDALYAEYKQADVAALKNRSWELVDGGGVNWFWGVDNNAVVKDQYGNSYRLDKLVNALVSEGMTKADAKDYVKKLQARLGA